MGGQGRLGFWYRGLSRPAVVRLWLLGALGAAGVAVLVLWPSPEPEQEWPLSSTPAGSVAPPSVTAPVADAAGSEKVPEIEYAYPDQSVWTMRTLADGTLANPLFPVAERIFSAAGLRWRGAAYPAARMFSRLQVQAQVQEESAAFSILVRAPALNDCCVWGKTVIARTELRAYHLPEKQGIRERHDLIGKRIATIRGYSYGGWRSFLADPANHIAVSAAGDHVSAFGMLRRGHVDYVLDYTGPAGEVLAEQPWPGLQGDIVDTLDVFMVLSRGYPDAEAVMARLDAIAAKVVAVPPPGRIR